MTNKLKDRVAIVTGGSRGIGAAIVRAFAEQGASVAFCHNATESEAQTVCEGWGGRVAGFYCDLGDKASLEEFHARVVEHFGPVDILVNNAGISGETSFEEISSDQLETMIGINLLVPFRLSQLVVPAMKARGWGRIINISSQLAYAGATGLAHYCASKGGIVSFTRALGMELAPSGILVNAIAPGLVDTRLNDLLSDEWKKTKLSSLPVRRMGVPADIAPTAVLLASEDGAFYVGQTLSPNGGDVFL